MQGYNCQLAVDSDHQVIVAVGVSNQSPDFEHLEPMLERIVASTGALPDVMTLDACYWSENNVNVCADRGKGCRSLRRFLLLGLEKVNGE